MAQNEKAKERLYKTVNLKIGKESAAISYAVMIIVSILAGYIPMFTRNGFALAIEVFTAVIFACDYFLKVFTSDYRMGYKNYRSYLVYAIMPAAIIDFFSIFPVMTMFSDAPEIILIANILRFLRLLKLFKLFSQANS